MSIFDNIDYQKKSIENIKIKKPLILLKKWVGGYILLIKL